jgi:hypothetical protein
MLYETTCAEDTPSCAHYRTYLKVAKAKSKSAADNSGSMASRAAA